jgi:hypothetical protein
MEENLKHPIISQPIQSEPAIESLVVPTKSKSVLPYLLIMFVVASIAAGALYFYNQSRSLNSQSTTNASPSPVPSPTDSSDILEIITL